MRLICEIKAAEKEFDPLSFSAYLSSRGIKNECEEAISDKGDYLYRVWVLDEDQVEMAQKLLESYRENPTQFAAEKTPEPVDEILKIKSQPIRRSPFMVKGFFSTAILVTVIILFFWSQMTRSDSVMPPKIAKVKEAPLLSPVERDLLFDYPYYFILRDEVLKLWPAKEIKEGATPSTEAKKLLSQMEKTPFWSGIYDRFLAHIEDPSEPLQYDGPMLEKISQGEVWRLITPTFLHYDFLHIFFNVLWFLILSGQIERRVGSFRYLILTVLAAVASNFGQYLMSGSFFLGLSGLVCAFAAFIWARQQVAPWEGYLLHRLTIIFLLIFVFGIFALQLFFFFTQLFFHVKLQMPIANTAHIVGGIVGYCLGRLKYFSIRR